NELCEWSFDVSRQEWVAPRFSELVNTSYDLRVATRADEAVFLFKSGSTRRQVLRAELNAALFHWYGMGRDDVLYIMDTFPKLKDKEMVEYNEYRTNRLILEAYDAMQHAIDTGTEYQTILDPP